MNWKHEASLSQASEAVIDDAVVTFDKKRNYGLFDENQIPKTHATLITLCHDLDSYGFCHLDHKPWVTLREPSYSCQRSSTSSQFLEICVPLHDDVGPRPLDPASTSKQKSSLQPASVPGDAGDWQMFFPQENWTDLKSPLQRHPSLWHLQVPNWRTQHLLGRWRTSSALHVV